MRCFRNCILTVIVLSSAMLLNACAAPAQTAVRTSEDIRFSSTDSWAYYAVGENKDADLFLIAPTTGGGKGTNASVEDAELRTALYGSLEMERGIYEDTARMFAPYYSQATMAVYSMPEQARQPYLEFAYRDVSEAFGWYLANENDGRPIILAGFSQGADMCYRLLEEYFDDPVLQEQLVACYAIGWYCTKDMTERYPQIVPAQGETDTGVVITFECEAPGVTDSLILPAGRWTYSINPLNWKTDSTPADRSLNKGACFYRSDGTLKEEIPGLCGCYIDEVRGSLIVPDVDPADYPALVPGIPEGGYHVYDCQFFFRNLQENVKVRTQAYLDAH